MTDKKLKAWLAAVSGLAVLLLIALIATNLPSSNIPVGQTATTAARTEATITTTTTTTEATTTTQATTAAQPELITLSVKQLFKEYAANEVRAGLLYKGKRIVVTGPICSIGSNFVSLEMGTDEFIRFYFKEEVEIAKVIEVSVDDIVTIEGIFSGKMNYKCFEVFNSRFK